MRAAAAGSARARRFAGFGLQARDARGEVVDRGRIELRRRRRGRLDRGPAQHPADADHERRRNRAGDGATTQGDTGAGGG